jgi:hypothetical protein
VFRIETLIGSRAFCYELELELPDGFQELRVKAEKLSVGDKVVFQRQEAQVSLPQKKAAIRLLLSGLIGT